MSQFSFIAELEKLKMVHRQNATLDGGRSENSAEHSWHLAMMVLILAEYSPQPIDTDKTIRLALIHDIVEVYAGDVFAFDEKARADAVERERVAAKQIAALLPQDQGQYYLDLWEEFEALETAEARFAKLVDSLQPLLNHSLTRPVDNNLHGLTRSQVGAKKQWIKDHVPEFAPLVDALIARSVERGLYHDR